MDSGRHSVELGPRGHRFTLAGVIGKRRRFANGYFFGPDVVTLAGYLRLCQYAWDGRRRNTIGTSG